MAYQNFDFPFTREDFYQNFKVFLLSFLIFFALFTILMQSVQPEHLQSTLNLKLEERYEILQNAEGSQKILGMIVSPPAVFWSILLLGNVQAGVSFVGAWIMGGMCMLFLFTFVIKKKLPPIVLTAMTLALLSPEMITFFLQSADLALVSFFLGGVLFFLVAFSEEEIYARIFLSSIGTGLLLQNSRGAFFTWAAFVPAIVSESHEKKIPFHFFLIFFFFPAFIFLIFPLVAEGLQTGTFTFESAIENSLSYYLQLPAWEALKIPQDTPVLPLLIMLAPYAAVSYFLLRKRFNWSLPWILSAPILYFLILGFLGSAQGYSVPSVFFLLPASFLACYFYIFEKEVKPADGFWISGTFFLAAFFQFTEPHLFA